MVSYILFQGHPKVTFHPNIHLIMLFISLGLLTLLPAVFGQSWQQYLDGLVQALNTSGLTTLSSASAALNISSEGQRVAQSLPTGNWTLFAPNNQAFSSAPPNLTSDPTSVGNLISYHVVHGNFTDQTSPYPTITLGRTLLNDTSLVQLEGNESQVLAWSKGSKGIFVLNNGTIVSVVNTTVYRNLQVLVIDSVLKFPQSLSDTLTNNTYEVTTFAGALSSVNVSTDNSTTLLDVFDNARGITLFAPNNTAFATANGIASLLPNTTALIALFENHVINGTSVYSPAFTNGQNYTSASGEPFTFITNSSGVFVSSAGSNWARIMRSDVLTSNGVVHVLDSVLLDVKVNASAASSAYQSATSVAASMTIETGPVGVAPTSTSSVSGR
ncbi:FAS1 domain-containing protein [Suillus clintonianus]|uniref:FAS1 domain-containing protein n=1 Tax=Suillus clintonianus TaxID=1904413 RepID=UPI001B8649AC|nr:FAS1 domain-containing protein [Suillus clintonianus]KAG2137543.1 FAS1 domain-containing protein [Suillus clintonianus]